MSCHFSIANRFLATDVDRPVALVLARHGDTSPHILVKQSFGIAAHGERLPGMVVWPS
ncbi:hypothetical protein BCR44DRAFT_1435275 [Catenaria anguillulae PL171]|uniref:Uncharacterized protein n=1 Tax=Catenaria anguillulae PL171 TaxID=765915 RepID=A0A1Y2HAC8_9FUNG|nr:hypothetical protein BCR44DRAFT_1443547 [Catenaria anguillulae PL171]ORZ34824.1 hypothetical protein BCR44DRAFT_1435882 [Catenaria anguillulae PL171]ORZ34854.1 hypothetical protein BCR44DRAFT_1435275 [Catenaria anguillulae PL171]